MDFSYTEAEEAFRREVRSWLSANLPAGWSSGKRNGPGDTTGDFEFQRAWDRTLATAGYTSGISWPVDYGGRGASIIEQLILYQELGRAQAPSELARQGRQLLGPTLIEWGTEEQKRKFLPPILSGEWYFCQGFSEPEAGSDLAGLRTRAEVDGQTLVVNGHKIWTTQAHRADWMFGLVRTDASGGRHHGISFVLIEMSSPGIEAVPVRTCTGGQDFCEVFFTDVRVPIENVIGPLNDGWQIVVSSLSHERATMGLGRYLIHRLEVSALRDLVAEMADVVDPHTLARADEQLGRCAIELEAFRLTGYWNVSKLLRGEDFGAKGSILKLQYSHLTQAIGEAAVELLDIGAASGSSRMSGRAEQWGLQFLESRAASIYAGTSEIQRNIVAERLMGLPR
jgi:alkylation response protein AidB-like acyl-CoA dehydrogenase